MNSATLHINSEHSIQAILMQKALLGAVPLSYTLVGVGPRWIPINWYDNPRLGTIEFSDGTYVQVRSDMELAIGKDEANGDDIPWDVPTPEALAASSLGALETALGSTTVTATPETKPTETKPTVGATPVKPTTPSTALADAAKKV